LSCFTFAPLPPLHVTAAHGSFRGHITYASYFTPSCREMPMVFSFACRATSYNIN
jgi:hypothetical protein